MESPECPSCQHTEFAFDGESQLRCQKCDHVLFSAMAYLDHLKRWHYDALENARGSLSEAIPAKTDALITRRTLQEIVGAAFLAGVAAQLSSPCPV